MKRLLFAFLAIVLTGTSALAADENVRAAQTRLKNDGFYFGEATGVVDSDTSSAISRYQIRNGLPITGQLDAETAKALGVTAAATTGKAAAPDSESWRRLRKSDRQFLERLETTRPGGKAGRSAPAQPAPREDRVAAEARPPQPAERSSAAPAGERDGGVFVLSRERLRDYVGAFVLAGLDPRVGAELEFFGESVTYYNRGLLRRDRIREDLQQYNNRWPQRRFWLDGEIEVQPQADSRVRVSFPLRYELRNGNKRSAGRVQKTLHLEVLGEDLQIVAVNERKI